VNIFGRNDLDFSDVYGLAADASNSGNSDSSSGN